MINYDRSSLKALIISPTAWNATPPLRWFDNFSIISISEEEPGLHELMHTHGIENYIEPGEDTTKTVGAMYASPALRRTLSANGLNEYAHILNRTNKSGAFDYRTIANDYRIIDKYESKSLFRRRFSSQIRMPRYELLLLKDWVKRQTYSFYTTKLSLNLVVQHPALSGSRGTFLVSSEEQFDGAIEKVLADLKHPTDEIVISERIMYPAERSLQVCILEDRVLVGPPQAQLVRNPVLTYDSQDSVQFCGGRVGSGLMTDEQYEEASAYARTIAAELKQAGYRGIFGIDLLIADQVYVIEANLRRTSLSPLLASLQVEVPYMLLHILELAKQPYSLAHTSDAIGEGSFITIYAQADGAIDLTTGLYDTNLNRLGDGFEDANLLPKEDKLFFVAMRIKPGETVRAGRSIAFVYSRTVLFDVAGELSIEGAAITRSVRSKFTES